METKPEVKKTVAKIIQDIKDGAPVAQQVIDAVHQTTSKNRWTSPVFLSAVGVALLFVLKVSGLLEWLGITANDYNDVWAIATGLYLSFAAYNNPTNKTGI